MVKFGWASRIVSKNLRRVFITKKISIGRNCELIMDDLDKIRKLKIEEIGKISVFYVDRDKKLAIKSTKSLRHGYDNNFIFSGYATKSLKKLVYLIKNNNNYQKSDFFSDKRFLLEITMWDQSSTEFFIDLDCKYLEIGDSEYEIKNNDVKNEYNYILRKYFLLK